jgi:DUF4097 and DUF4098 domain-containing protein YvlB
MDMRPKQLYSSLLAAVVILVLVALQPLPAAASAEGTFQKTLQVSGAVNIDLNTGSGSVQVRTGSSNEVQVTGHIRVNSWSGDADERVKHIESNPPIEQNGNDIRIGHTAYSEMFHNVSISYELIVPAETQLHSHTGSGSQRVEGLRGSLEIEAGSGDLKISEAGSTVHADTGSGNIEMEHVNGNVHAKTGSGSIHAEGIAGGFEAHTGSGHIILEQTAPGSVRAGTGSGGMELRGVRGSLEATAGSGEVTAEGNPTGSWTLHTGSGNVRLKLASDAAFDLEAHTSSGRISVEQPVTVQGTMGRKDLHGKVRGGGVPVEVETGSGNIEIQ